jgi:uncharacterized membrane-anchored protein
MMAQATPAKPFLLPAAIAATLVLCGLIAWMIESRAVILREGTEIVLESEPVDPRDLLRGRYVVLGYPAQRIGGPMLDPLRAEIGEGETIDDATVYVTLRQGPDGYHEPVAVSLAEPDEDLFIRARANRVAHDMTWLFLDFGIGRFYTNEHRAPELERRMREGELTEIVVAVAPDGTAQIKALRQAGETIVTEPLY